MIDLHQPVGIIVNDRNRRVVLQALAAGRRAGLRVGFEALGAHLGAGDAAGELLRLRQGRDIAGKQRLRGVEKARLQPLGEILPNRRWP
jgi:hypothetical protein